jgi:prefoldin subunit 5
MSEVNYNETVILPFLEKRCKELLSLNLVLEARLLSCTEERNNLQREIDSLRAKEQKKRKGKDIALDGETY